MPCGRRWRSFVPHSIHRWLTDLEHTACGLRRPHAVRGWREVTCQRCLGSIHAKLAAQTSALGPPRERADRDFRKQTIMTVRTLLLENALMSFMAVLVGTLTMQVSLDCL